MIDWLVVWFLCQFNNYSLQLYTVQKCIMSTLIGLFYIKVSLTIMVSNEVKISFLTVYKYG